MSRLFTDTDMQPLYGFCHFLSRTIYDMLFRGEVAGAHHVPRSGPFLLASNHASFLDPILIGSQTPRQITYFARKTLWVGGFASWWLDGVGTIPVDRDGGQDISAIKRVLRALQDGKALVVFPEGTRTPDGRLQSPKPGVGLIACRAQAPVVPMRLFGTFEAMGKGQPLRLGTPVSIVFGRPILPAEYDRPSAGKDRYQIASDRIFAGIRELQRPRPRVV